MRVEKRTSGNETLVWLIWREGRSGNQVLGPEQAEELFRKLGECLAPDDSDAAWLRGLADELDQAVRMTFVLVKTGVTVEGAQYLRFDNRTAHEMADRLRQIAGRLI